MTTLTVNDLPIGFILIDSDEIIRETNLIARNADIWTSTPLTGTRLSDCIASPELLGLITPPEISDIPYTLVTEKGENWQITFSFDGDNKQLFLKNETELNQLRKKVTGLERNIERLDLAIQGANLGIWDFNPSMGQIIGNRTWATQKKLSPEEVFADDSLFSEVVNGIEKWGSLVHPDDLSAATQKIQDHLDGKTDLYHAEFRIKCGDGSWKWILDQGKVFERDDNGSVTRMNGIHVDVDKLKELQQKLTETKDKAEVANRAKSTFLTNMSHELRTPLNAILGYSQLMKNDERLFPQYQEYIDIINRSGEHLLSLINDVLDMSKIDAGHNIVERKWFNFKDVVEEVKDLMQMKATQKQLSFQCAMSELTPHYVLGDAVKTRQILINLIGNAIKFTHKGSVNLAIDTHSVGDKSNKFHFIVSDTGEGIDSADLERVFIPFEQVGSETTQKGTGLGLSISKQFVELMGGRLEVQSVKGEGSTFTFTLEMDTSDSIGDTDKECTNTPQVIGLKSGSISPKILVAEDQADNQKLIMTVLSEAGFTVKLARDGEEAISLNNSWNPDFIWMDRRMPKIDGLQATKEIRRTSGNGELKIVALTASVFNDEVQEMLQAGMDDFARKPFLTQDLFKIMAKHLDIKYDYQSTQPEDSVNSKTLTLDKEGLIATLSLEQIVKILSAIEEGNQQELICLFEHFFENRELRAQLIDLVESYQFDDLYELFQS